MTTRSKGVRESRSVRLHQSEWDLAEVIAFMTAPESNATAGQGLRRALSVAADRLRRQGRGAELESLLHEVAAGRAARDTR